MIDTHINGFAIDDADEETIHPEGRETEIALPVDLSANAPAIIAAHPRRIEQLIIKLGESAHDLTALKERMEEIEINFVLEVAAMRGADAKPLYANEAMRRAALVLRLQESDFYRELKEELVRTETERTQLSARLERLRYEVRIHIAHA